MFYGRVLAFWILAISLLSLSADAQSVISTHSGTVHFFEGVVYLGNQALESHPGKFASIPEGGELRTENGRAEVLLTPGVFLRLGERSSIRMVATDLRDTRVELLKGSAIVESAEPSAGTSVTLVYKTWKMRFPKQGVYRIDSDPARLWVLQGKAEVSADTNNKERPVSVEQGTYVPFAAVLVPERSVDQPRDALSTWAEGRQQSISADNAIAANIQDPASMNGASPDPDSFTYYPMLALPPIGSGLSSPSNSVLAQPGFNSIYLPGYTYLPAFLGIAAAGFPISVQVTPHAGLSPVRIPRIPVSPLRSGGSVGSVGSVYPRPMAIGPAPAYPRVAPAYPRVTPVHPVSPPVRSAPMPVHSSPIGGIRGAVHR
jgi:hypothetical protein